MSEPTWVAEARLLRARGLTYGEIAERVGVGYSGVWKQLNPEAARAAWTRSNEKRLELCQMCGERPTRDGRRCWECAEEAARQVPHTAARAEQHGGLTRGVHHWSDEALIAVLRGLADENGRLSAPDYNEAYRRNPGLPAPRTFLLRWDTWNGTLHAAGLTTIAPYRTYTRFTAEDCIAWVGRAAEDMKCLPSVGDYEAWRALDHPEAPSQATIRGRCGNWLAVLKALEAEQAAA